MAPSDVPSDSFLQLLQRPRLGSALREQRPVHVFTGVPTSATHYDLSILVVPLENGSGTDAQLSADFGRHGDLALGRELRLRECHP